LEQKITATPNPLPQRHLTRQSPYSQKENELETSLALNRAEKSKKAIKIKEKIGVDYKYLSVQTMEKNVPKT